MKKVQVVIPMVRKKKHHGRKPYSVEIQAMQFALEQAVKDSAALKKQCDGLAKLDKARNIDMNLMRLTINRLRERIERSDSE